MIILESILSISLSAAPWLLLGFFLAGLIKAFISDLVLQKYAGGTGFFKTVRAAFIGMPLPLCSCGAIPTAMSLYRGGAGRGPTTAFLISTPGAGIDSIMITWALLGPFMMAARVAGALLTAVGTGLMVSFGKKAPNVNVDAVSGCVGTCSDSCSGNNMAIESSLFRRLADGLKYSFTELLDDMSRWLIGGLVIAGIIMAMIPPSALVDFSSGFFAMLLMALIGIPMYICAAAATPIAAAMIMAGVSPGTVLVFLLAAPVTSMATLGVYSKEMGRGVLLRYLGSIIFFSIAAGLFVDSIISYTGIDVQAQAIVFTEFLPEYLERLSLGLLIFLAVKPLRQTSMSLVKKTINFFRKI